MGNVDPGKDPVKVQVKEVTTGDAHDQQRHYTNTKRSQKNFLKSVYCTKEFKLFLILKLDFLYAPCEICP